MKMRSMMWIHPRSSTNVGIACLAIPRITCVTNKAIAPGMFSQIDVLSLPGAGLRHLDFPQVGSLFQAFYAGDESPSHVQLEPMPSPMSTTSCLVRTYGSEAEM